MKVLVAGATGVIGRQLVPLLAGVGHDVVELVRPGTARERGGDGVVVADALDGAALSTALRRLAPDAVVDLLTAIPRRADPRHIARDMAPTNRLRTEATANLIAAAPAPASSRRDSPTRTGPPVAAWPTRTSRCGPTGRGRSGRWCRRSSSTSG